MRSLSRLTCSSRLMLKEELEDVYSARGQAGLEIVDLVEPTRPNVPGDQVMHTHYQHVLVVRAVENADLPASGGNRPVDAPQEIVGQLFGRRLFEGRHTAALRVDRASRGGSSRPFTSIHRLQDNQQRPLALGIEQLLQVRQADSGLSCLGASSFFRTEAFAVIRGMVGHLKLAAWFHKEPFNEFHVRVLPLPSLWSIPVQTSGKYPARETGSESPPVAAPAGQPLQAGQQARRRTAPCPAAPSPTHWPGQTVVALAQGHEADVKPPLVRFVVHRDFHERRHHGPGRAECRQTGVRPGAHYARLSAGPRLDGARRRSRPGPCRTCSRPAPERRRPGRGSL